MEDLLEIGAEITIPRCGKFVEQLIKLVEIKKAINVVGESDSIYCFDNGLKLCTYDLQVNIELWDSRRKRNEN